MNQIHLLLNEIYSRFCYKMVDMALEHQSACKYIEMSALFIINEGFQIWVIVHLSAAPNNNAHRASLGLYCVGVGAGTVNQ